MTVRPPARRLCRWGKLDIRPDVTGGFCTSGSEREFTLEERWYADEERCQGLISLDTDSERVLRD